MRGGFLNRKNEFASSLAILHLSLELARTRFCRGGRVLDLQLCPRRHRAYWIRKSYLYIRKSCWIVMNLECVVFYSCFILVHCLYTLCKIYILSMYYPSISLLSNVISGPPQPSSAQLSPWHIYTAFLPSFLSSFLLHSFHFLDLKPCPTSYCLVY